MGKGKQWYIMNKTVSALRVGELAVFIDQLRSLVHAVSIYAYFLYSNAWRHVVVTAPEYTGN